MKKLSIMILVVYLTGPSYQLISVFDQFAPQARVLKDIFLNYITTPLTRNSAHLRTADELRKLQPRVKDDVPFPCPINGTRSSSPPTSVHKVRPGDIDIIAAMGDSLTAGNGLVATNVLHVVIENRGISFATGGQGTWRQYVTLANIFKEFNPNLLGYSWADGFGHHKSTHFNVAEGGAVSNDMPYMSKVLVKRIMDDPRVDIHKHWKLVNFLIGSNDFCSEICYRKNPEVIVEEHRKELTTVLRTIRDNLPRTIVNILLQPNLKILTNATKINRPPICYFTHVMECSCLFALKYENQQAKFEEIMLKWQQVEREVSADPEFERDDFAVVLQPLTLNYKLSTTKEGLTDYSIFSEDCFHVSQKEGAKVALSLWNNLIEPYGKKTTHAVQLFDFKCPTSEQPYIFTRNQRFVWLRQCLMLKVVRWSHHAYLPV